MCTYQKLKTYFNVNPSAMFYVRTNILTNFQVSISVSLKQQEKLFESLYRIFGF